MTARKQDCMLLSVEEILGLVGSGAEMAITPVHCCTVSWMVQMKKAEQGCKHQEPPRTTLLHFKVLLLEQH